MCSSISVRGLNISTPHSSVLTTIVEGTILEIAFVKEVLVGPVIFAVASVYQYISSLP